MELIQPIAQPLYCKLIKLGANVRYKQSIIEEIYTQVSPS